MTQRNSADISRYFRIVCHESIKLGGGTDFFLLTNTGYRAHAFVMKKMNRGFSVPVLDMVPIRAKRPHSHARRITSKRACAVLVFFKAIYVFDLLIN